MSLEDLGNLGEFLSALAVVVSLLYLAVQIRQNSRMLRSTASQSAARNSSDFATALISDRELLRLFVAGRRDLSDLSPEDRDVFSTIIINLFYSYESGFYQLQDGTGARALPLRLLAQRWHGASLLVPTPSSATSSQRISGPSSLRDSSRSAKPPILRLVRAGMC